MRVIGRPSRHHAKPTAPKDSGPKVGGIFGQSAHSAPVAGHDDKLRAWASQTAASRPTRPPQPPEVVEPAEPPPSVRDRPQGLDDMVGQEALLGQLRMVCAGSRLRGTPMPHCLLAGPAGHGKTTLSGIIARELGATLVVTTGMMLRKPADLVGMLVKATGPTVLFIDEVHALPKPVMEVLYEVLEDGRISTLVGSGNDTVPYQHELTGFVCVGATTRPGVLTTPFRQRFGFFGTVEQYTAEELAEIVRRAWEHVGVTHGALEPLEVAHRCKGVPRRALHLAERVLDFGAVQGLEGVPDGTVHDALAVFGIDEDGLEENDFRILEKLTGEFAGRTVGLAALSQSLDMDPKSIEEQYEPYLSQAGLIQRTKTGRMALPAAYELLQVAP